MRLQAGYRKPSWVRFRAPEVVTMAENAAFWEKLGFSAGEGRVYGAILNSDGATLQLVHERTGIERRNVYDIINKLISKGLVSYFSENGHKVYRANHPSKILAHFEEAEHEISDKKAALSDEMPTLLKAYNASKPKFDVRIYRGKEGIRAIFTEMLDFPDQYFIGGNWGIIKYLGEEWFERYTKKRIAKKIWMHDIVTQPSKFLAPAPKMGEFYEVKFLPPQLSSPNVILVFGNRLVNLFWGDPLLAFVIENDEIAKNYVGYFEYLWKTLPQPKKA